MHLDEFHYRLPWRTRSARPGHHPGSQTGGGLEFRDRRPFLDAPDARRIDLVASARDTYGRLLVRIYQQQSTVPVYVLADLSGSMHFTGAGCKLDVLADFTRAAGYSAYRTGDPFGFVGFDRQVLDELSLAPLHHKGLGPELAARLAARTAPGRAGAQGIVAAAQRVGGRMALVFLVSDFYFELSLLRRALDLLRKHLVVPVVLSDSVEHVALPRSGIVRVRDAETGRRRTLLMRRALRERIEGAFLAQRDAVRSLCLAHGRKPLFIEDRFAADAVTRYFYG